MNIYLNMENDKIYLLHELLNDLSNKRRFSKNYMMKMDIEDGKKYIIKFFGDINRKECIRMSLIILNLMKNVNDEPEFDINNLFIRCGV